MVSQISSYLLELNEIEERLLVSKVGNDRWRSPEAPFLKINFDIAFKAHFTKSYSGLVVRDDRSRVIGKKVILMTEAFACLQALKLGVEMGLRDVIIEGDSLTVIKKGWIRGENLNLGQRDLVAIVTLEARDNLVRGVEGEDEVVGL
ncbi:TOM1-like protein 2 [Gossypium australe]|uniref:TOM1-like protein 2 n=1 Tax=Gossypium australe TaxID=47621 RepID=A0A5B6V0U0_9ROSI|nr:TOM1-like protein 2 [Gossypium australe]